MCKAYGLYRDEGQCVIAFTSLKLLILMQGFGVNWSDLWKDLIPVLFHWYKNHHRMASHSKLKGWWITQYNSHFDLANFHPIISHQQSRLHHQVFENFRFPTHRFCLSRPSGDWWSYPAIRGPHVGGGLILSSWCPYVVAWPFLYHHWLT